MTRKSKQDWLEMGLKTLGQAGLKGLTIDRMALELGVTKGSFYHHFENAQDFEGQLLQYWADQYLTTSNSLPESPAELLALLDTLMKETFGPVTEPEIPIRMWAAHNENARSFVEEVDQFRRQFVFDIFLAVTKDKGRARLMADMLFTMTIGSMTTLPRISPERILDLYREFKRLYSL